MSVTFDDAYRGAIAAATSARFEEAVTLLRRARELAPNDAERARVDMQCAALPLLQGDVQASLNVFRENLVRRDSPLNVWTALYYLLIAATDRNDRASVERYLEPFLDATREL